MPRRTLTIPAENAVAARVNSKSKIVAKNRKAITYVAMLRMRRW